MCCIKILQFYNNTLQGNLHKCKLLDPGSLCHRLLSSSSSWREAISRSIQPLRFAAKTICPQPAREHQSPIFLCPGGSDGSNRVLGASPPDISPLECLLPRSVHTALAQLRSGHCRLLNSYKARITSSISDVCPECGVAPHSVEHLFNCQSHPSQLKVQDLWDNPAAVADFLNLDN